jgi:hypothetical protein
MKDIIDQYPNINDFIQYVKSKVLFSNDDNITTLQDLKKALEKTLLIKKFGQGYELLQWWPAITAAYSGLSVNIDQEHLIYVRFIILRYMIDILKNIPYCIREQLLTSSEEEYNQKFTNNKLISNNTKTFLGKIKLFLVQLKNYFTNYMLFCTYKYNQSIQQYYLLFKLIESDKIKQFNQAAVQLSQSYEALPWYKKIIATEMLEITDNKIDNRCINVDVTPYLLGMSVLDHIFVNQSYMMRLLQFICTQWNSLLAIFNKKNNDNSTVEFKKSNIIKLVLSSNDTNDANNINSFPLTTLGVLTVYGIIIKYFTRELNTPEQAIEIV